MPEIGIGIGIEVGLPVPIPIAIPILISIQRARYRPCPGQGMIRDRSAGLRPVPAANPTYPARSDKCQQPLVQSFV